MEYLPTKATTSLHIHILMNNTQPIGGYQDKALADADCHIMNEAEKYSPDPMPYWVKTIPVVVDDLVIA